MEQVILVSNKIMLNFIFYQSRHYKLIQFVCISKTDPLFVSCYNSFQFWSKNCLLFISNYDHSKLKLHNGRNKFQKSILSICFFNLCVLFSYFCRLNELQVHISMVHKKQESQMISPHYELLSPDLSKFRVHSTYLFNSLHVKPLYCQSVTCYLSNSKDPIAICFYINVHSA